MAIDASTAPVVEQTPSTVITVSGILGDLNNGLDRKAIQEKYGLSAAEVTEVFKHPKLKGLRARKKITRISIVDDTVNPVTIPVTQPVTVPNQLTTESSQVVTDPNQLDLLDMIVEAQAEM